MSLALLRDGPLSAKRNDRTASLRKLTSRLRALNAVTTAITQHCGLAPCLDVDFDSTIPPPQSSEEKLFLDENDITKGRYFRDATLPVAEDAIEQLVRKSSPTEEVTRNDARQVQEEASGTTSVASRIIPDYPRQLSTLVSDAATDLAPQNPGALLDDTDATALDPGPLRPEDVVNEITPANLIEPSTEQRPRIVHLPPKATQEEQLRERQLNRDAAVRKDLNDVEKLSGEPTSSPTSTAEAHSTTTPVPVEHSSVTSADDEVIAEADSASETSRQVTALDQKQSATGLSVPGDVVDEDSNNDFASPDVQLRLEQEQAAKANRDAAAKLSQTSVVSPPVAASMDHATIIKTAELDLKTTARDTSVPSGVPQETSVNATTTNNTKAQGSQEVVEAVQTVTAQGIPESDTTSITKPAEPSVASTLVPVPRSRSDVPPETTKSSLPREQRSTLEDRTPTAVARPKIIPTEAPTRRNPRVAQDVIASPPIKHQTMLPNNNKGYEALRGAADDPARDYLEPLFRIQIHDTPNGRPLHELLQKASKIVSTADQFAGTHEKQDQRILRRIYQLQNANRWSLRQMEPCDEPAAPQSHVDHLLAEMKWMRTDFRQERKMKKATAKYLAERCAEWVHADRNHRRSMQVMLRPAEVHPDVPKVPHSPAETTAENGDRQSQDDKSPPALDLSLLDQDDSPIEEVDMPRTPQYATVPSSFYTSMNMDEDTYHLQGTKEFHEAIAELPMYDPFGLDRSPSPAPHIVPAVSKFCAGKIIGQVAGPPGKRSRFDYEDEDEIVHDSHAPAKRPRASQEGSGLPPDQTDVALFDPENKLLRDRLHSNTTFRPPSEFPMPSSQFYEFRTSSQWIADDDQRLRRLAKDYSFNWSLIADEMSTELRTKLPGAADRRTPWECFERWVELESLPNEMRKTLYFKTWNQRLETAQKKNDERYQLQVQAQSQLPGQPQQIMRRRTQPVRVEKRRSNRYLHVVDAMRKLARKREQQAHKQAEAQKAASLRKQHENAAPKSIMHTPQEFSRMRHERDVQLAERQARYREQMLAQQRQAAQMQRSGQYPGQQQPHINPAQQQRPGTSAPHAQNAPLQPGPARQPGNATQLHAQGGQQGNQVPVSNNHLAVPQMNMQGNIPQAQMQPNMRTNLSQQNHNQADITQQRMTLDAQRQAQLSNQSSAINGQYRMGPPATPSPGGIMNHQPNQAMMAAMQNNSHHGAHSAQPGQQAQGSHQHGNTTTSASPHMPPPQNPASHPQQLSSGHVPAIAQISHQLKVANPNATPEQIRQMTNDRLNKQWIQKGRENALNAAAGNYGNPPSNTNAYVQNPTQNQSHPTYQNNNTNVPNGHNPYNTTTTPNLVNGSKVPVSANMDPSRYASDVRRAMLQQQQNQLQQQSSPATVAARPPTASPRPPQATPAQATHNSPSMAQSVPAQNGSNMNGVNKPATPQMARIGSSGGGAGVPGTPGSVGGAGVVGQQSAMPSPSLQQGSPRTVAAGPGPARQ